MPPSHILGGSFWPLNGSFKARSSGRPRPQSAELKTVQPDTMAAGTSLGELLSQEGCPPSTRGERSHLPHGGASFRCRGLARTETQLLCLWGSRRCRLPVKYLPGRNGNPPASQTPGELRLLRRHERRCPGLLPWRPVGASSPSALKPRHRLASRPSAVTH